MKHICFPGVQIRDTDLYHRCFPCLSAPEIKSFLTLQRYLFQSKYPVSNAVSGSVEVCWVNWGYIYELGQNFIGLTPKVETWHLLLLPAGLCLLWATLYLARTSHFSLDNHCLHICVSSETEHVESKNDVLIFVCPGSQSLAQCQAHYVLAQSILLSERR